ncbi:hypothetical protein LX97_02043 [Nonlabens dokdonensis]|uniref:Oxygen sensor histidine kinase NreB n=2 Tax=Nonlabens dokdonensis TaxID=328515 RepID=L7WC46_NONDD|nr:sensor histidine kinase [Nonlabens dokdonensis]AGC77777.1 sensor protein [Nonlabens dokdonensis DSW-6]PZX39689.1 hypothetical protein LX97_02043 [Nonlabens dokdonensis]
MFKICFSSLLFLSFFAFSQQPEAVIIDSLHKLIENENFHEAEELTKQIDSSKLSQNELGSFYLSLANIYLAYEDHEKAYEEALKAKEVFTKLENSNLLFKTNDLLLDIVGILRKPTAIKEQLVEENCEIASSSNDVEKKISCNSRRALLAITSQDYSLAVELFRKIDELARDEGKNNIALKNLSNIGVAHYLNGNLDSTLYYYDKKEVLLKINKDVDELAYLYNNYGQLYNEQHNFTKAISYFQKALELDLTKEIKTTRLIFLENIAGAYANNEEYKKATESYQEIDELREQLEPDNLMANIQELETKYQTTQKEKENLELKAATEAQRAQIYALSSGAAILVLLGLFIYNNQRKKKLLAQKEQELEKQRADTILKNQELATIDAMITGQEKERKKLAEELHDNLGSSLTTVKLYFENLKNNVKDEQGLEVYHRTEQILDDTYETIRTMSHNRNNGVLASKGLIPSIQTLTDKITSSGKLNVEFIHHGLDKKLESSMELIIFRTVQELLNNIMKHAQASVATINLTSYDENLNIMVEDNGTGFNATVLPQSDGMGLSNIEKRVENLEGTFEVDSHVGRGTTINIDIPYYDKTNYS